jgi:hypothetical protein
MPSEAEGRRLPFNAKLSTDPILRPPSTTTPVAGFLCSTLVLELKRKNAPEP